MRVEHNLNDWFAHFSNEKKLTFTVSTNKRLREVMIMADGNLFYLNYSIEKQAKPTAAQRHNYEEWAVAKNVISNAGL